MKKFLFLCSTMLLILVLADGVSANLIANGDFEAGGGSFSQWDTNGDMRIGGPGLVPWAQGMDNHYALFGFDLGNDTSTLRQTFNVGGADFIRVSFNWAFDYIDFSSQEDTFMSVFSEAGAGGLRIRLLDLSTEWGIGLQHGFYDQVLDISAMSRLNANLGFQLGEADGRGLLGSAAGIDNVSINAVPEPSTMLLLGFGLLGLAGAGRKKFLKK